jgi:glycosyltransferase involved in cell wall biosynthesis
MEYLVLGKAIVAPTTPNLLEILSDGTNAAMFDESQHGSLQATLTSLCRDSGLRDRLAEAARQTIDDLQLTWIGNARRVVALANSRISAS